MRLFRLFVATFCLATFWLSATPVYAAGTLTFSPLRWGPRSGKDRLINVLNRQDCLDDVVATSVVQVRGVPTSGVQFEIWAGSGCDQQTNRAPASTTRTCSKVKGDLAILDQTIEIKMRDLIKPFGTDTPATDASVCDTATSTGLISRTLYFVIFDSTTFASAITGSPNWAYKFDIKAPAPPTNVSAGAGDKTLVASFTAPSGESNLLRYHFYCSVRTEAPVDTGTGGTDTGGTAATDTGGTDTGGTDTGAAGAEAAAATGGDASGGTSGTAGTAGTAGTSTTADPTCTSSVLKPGEPPPADAIDCGTVTAQGASGGETSPVLANDGDFYAVAVATEDNVNNIGVLSGLACAQPRDVTGFYEAYREAGGSAGGGYCSFAPGKHGALATLFALGLGALALLRRRK
jgi:hypothetical protein